MTRYSRRSVVTLGGDAVTAHARAMAWMAGALCLAVAVWVFSLYPVGAALAASAALGGGVVCGLAVGAVGWVRQRGGARS